MKEKKISSNEKVENEEGEKKIEPVLTVED